MLDYYLAVFQVMGNALLRQVVCERSEAGATWMAELLMPSIALLKPELLSVTAVPNPRWNLALPLTIEEKQGYTSLDVRRHFLAGGVISCDYQGREYLAMAVLCEMKELGDKFGTAYLSCTQSPGRVMTIELDPIDDSHALEHMDSRLIVFASEIDHAEGPASTRDETSGIVTDAAQGALS